MTGVAIDALPDFQIVMRLSLVYFINNLNLRLQIMSRFYIGGHIIIESLDRPVTTDVLGCRSSNKYATINMVVTI